MGRERENEREGEREREGGGGEPTYLCICHTKPHNM